jgi:hypothetical protein
MSGIVYLLINPVLPGLTKIGKTNINGLESRLQTLYNTSVPIPFHCFYACVVEDPDLVEKKLHDAFGDHRVNKKREFFEIDAERVKSVLELLAINDVTPTEEKFEDADDKVAYEKASEIRSRINFKMLDIPIGSTLTFSKDENIVATVVTNRTIEYSGEETSISSSAADILTSQFGYKSRAVSGSDYWTFEGEKLWERRHRLEREG